MKINDSNSSYNSLYEATQSQKKATQVANSKTENNEVVYEKGNQQEDNTIKSDYSHLKSTKYVVDKSEIESMKAELDEKVQQSFKGHTWEPFTSPGHLNNVCELL